jgi:hypothetical protein
MFLFTALPQDLRSRPKLTAFAITTLALSVIFGVAVVTYSFLRSDSTAAIVLMEHRYEVELYLPTVF